MGINYRFVYKIFGLSFPYWKITFPINLYSNTRSSTNSLNVPCYWLCAVGWLIICLGPGVAIIIVRLDFAVVTVYSGLSPINQYIDSYTDYANTDIWRS